MEAILFLIAFYGGIALLGYLFSAIGKWNDERKSKIRDEVAYEVLLQTNINEELVQSYKKKLEIIGYSGDTNYTPYYYGKKSYRGLLGNCPECGNGYLRVVSGKNGKFIGCSSYPKCRYTVSVSEAKEVRNQGNMQEFIELLNLAYK